MTEPKMGGEGGMPKVDRQKSVFEVQRADVQRLLGEAMGHLKNWGRLGPIIRAEQCITDAQAVLDNMEGPDVDREEVAEFMYSKLRSAGPGWEVDEDETTKALCYEAANAAIEFFVKA